GVSRVSMPSFLLDKMHNLFIKCTSPDQETLYTVASCLAKLASDRFQKAIESQAGTNFFAVPVNASIF
ncbi:MAG: hypothetical protein V7K94_10550, partial [Nostoc sp.]|uniref:hypothetical protein n=1 Tax=Nostoc sp. TaxID=1180 RepID=UPI002FFA1C6A